MNNKLLIPAIIFILTIVLTSCSKECKSKSAACSDTPPTNELCNAAFKRWFYIKENKKCEQIEYGGCTQKGFTTQQECEECKCK